MFIAHAAGFSRPLFYKERLPWRGPFRRRPTENPAVDRYDGKSAPHFFMPIVTQKAPAILCQPRTTTEVKESK